MGKIRLLLIKEAKEKYFETKAGRRIYLINKLHSANRWLLYNYLNFDFLNNSKRDISQLTLNSVKSIQKILKLLISEEKKFIPLLGILNSKLSSNILINYFDNFYKNFDELIASDLKYLTIKQEVQKIPDFNLKEYADFNYIEPILNLTKKLKEFNSYIKGFYVSGSIATMDYIKGWSDFDSVLLLKNNIFNNKEALLNLKQVLVESVKDLRKIDQLQLHGVFILTELDLKYFSQAFYPFILFNYSKKLIGAKKLNFNLRESDQECWESFWHECISYFLNKQGFSINLKKKLLIHRILSLPFLFLQALGLHSYKKHSFEIIKIYFNKTDLKILDLATKAMNDSNKFLDLSEEKAYSLYNEGRKLSLKMLSYVNKNYGL